MCDEKNGKKRTPACGSLAPFLGPIRISDEFYEEVDPVVDEDGRERKRIRVHFGDPEFEGLVYTEYVDELVDAELVEQIPMSPVEERRFDLVERSHELAKAQIANLDEQ